MLSIIVHQLSLGIAAHRSVSSSHLFPANEGRTQQLKSFCQSRGLRASILLLLLLSLPLTMFGYRFHSGATGIVSPAPGSTLSGSTVTFAWAAGTDVRDYVLHLNTQPGDPIDPSSSRLYNSGALTSTSIAVPNVPTAGATIYAILGSEINGTWHYVTYSFTEASTTAASLSSLSCVSGSITGASTDTCTATLSSASKSSLAVSLASSNSTVIVPASVTVPAGSTSASFTATVSSVTTAQTATLTASAGGQNRSFALQLSAATSSKPSLTINASSIAFGSVNLNSPATQSVTLSSTGTSPLTINSVTASGAGFSLSGASFPLTLSPNQTATLNVAFDPTAAGAATGSLTVSSNSSTSPTAVVSLSGTGAASSYEVNLSWSAPASSSDPVSGYNVYRSPSGGSSYQQINTATVTQTSYVDTSVQAGQTYDYIVESLDSSGATSGPSNMASVATP
jgi:Abnormal spindle-like microcephaly-assoc'd, ASPM-SPD-2-Hydin/Fibronectin type III domain